MSAVPANKSYVRLSAQSLIEIKLKISITLEPPNQV